MIKQTTLNASKNWPARVWGLLSPLSGPAFFQEERKGKMLINDPKTGILRKPTFKEAYRRYREKPAPRKSGYMTGQGRTPGQTRNPAAHEFWRKVLGKQGLLKKEA